jgi:hypothetical protein
VNAALDVAAVHVDGVGGLSNRSWSRGRGADGCEGHDGDGDGGELLHGCWLLVVVVKVLFEVRLCFVEEGVLFCCLIASLEDVVMLMEN